MTHVNTQLVCYYFCMPKNKKIIIVGGGFGGLYTLKNLLKNQLPNEFDIILISEKNYFLFTPMIHEVATGGLDQELIVESIREVIKKNDVNFVNQKVIKVNLDKKTVVTANSELTYDYLVLATGATTCFYGGTFYDEVFTLKTVNDAVNIKNNIIETLEKANSGEDTNLNFIVVGGGPTGVELVVEIHEFIFQNLLKFYKNINKDEVNIYLLNASDSLISYFDKDQQEFALNYLKKLGIKVRNNSMVNNVENNKVFTSSDIIESKNVVWVPGVVPRYPELLGNIVKGENGRLHINEFLQLTNYENVFALGDVAAGFPMLAYTATRQAEVVSKNIIALAYNKVLTKFKFVPVAKLLSLGQFNALGEIGGVKLKGIITWFIWRTVYLTKIITFRKKVKIALNWTFNLFTPRDITKI